jgi:hypothetical protein
MAPLHGLWPWSPRHERGPGAREDCLPCGDENGGIEARSGGCTNVGDHMRPMCEGESEIWRMTDIRPIASVDMPPSLFQSSGQTAGVGGDIAPRQRPALCGATHRRFAHPRTMLGDRLGIPARRSPNCWRRAERRRAMDHLSNLSQSTSGSSGAENVGSILFLSRSRHAHVFPNVL